MTIRLAIASDHAGFALKETVKKKCTSAGADAIEWQDFGPESDARTDYPDFAAKVGEVISTKKHDRAVLICGSGIGMCIAANKFKGVRAAVVESVQTAALSRAHNNANVLCLGARILDPERAIEMIKTWLTTPFEGGRHADRVEKISKLEKGK